MNTSRRRLVELARRYGGARERLRDETLRGLGGESGGGLSDLPIHLADLGSACADEETQLCLLENEEQLLEECEAALARIQTGTFGRCESCRCRIARGRLLAVPYARHCLACARRLEAQPTG
jgi:RNA polymerase-binding transcription factor DksA